MFGKCNFTEAQSHEQNKAHTDITSERKTDSHAVTAPNAELRPREHLTEREIGKLIPAARGNRWGQRDAAMILIAFRHGLRASELCALQWSDVEFRVRHAAPAQGQGRGNGDPSAVG